MSIDISLFLVHTKNNMKPLEKISNIVEVSLLNPRPRAVYVVRILFLLWVISAVMGHSYLLALISSIMVVTNFAALSTSWNEMDWFGKKGDGYY